MKRISNSLKIIGVLSLKFGVFLFYTVIWSLSLICLEYDAYIRNLNLDTIAYILFSAVITWLLSSIYFSKKYLLKEKHKNTAVSYSFLSHILIGIAVFFFIYWAVPPVAEQLEDFGQSLPVVTAVLIQLYKYVVILPLAGSAAYIFFLKSRILSDKTAFILNVSDSLLILTNIVVIFAIVAMYVPLLRMSSP